MPENSHLIALRQVSPVEVSLVGGSSSTTASDKQFMKTSSSIIGSGGISQKQKLVQRRKVGMSVIKEEVIAINKQFKLDKPGE